MRIKSPGATCEVNHPDAVPVLPSGCRCKRISKWTHWSCTMDAIEFLIDKLKSTKTNGEFFQSMNT